MTTAPQRRADAQSRLRKAYATLGGARALLALSPPLRDDAVNRASSAALQAARALVDSQWAKESQPGWDPTWRPGMPRPGQPKDLMSHDALRKLLDRFQVIARKLSLEADFTDYIRALVEDGLDADLGDVPEYDDEEARVAIDTAARLIYTVAEQVGLGEELNPHRQPSLPKTEQQPGNPVLSSGPP